MTSSDSGSTRPGRIAGVALLGLAAVALVIGLITIFGGNGDGRADGNDEDLPPRPTTSDTRPPSSRPSTTRPPSSTTSSKVPPTTTTPPSTSRPPGDGNGETTKSTPVRVLNNSKIKGLAAEAADDFRADGWQVVEVGNYSATNVATTTAYFRPGTDEEAAARALAAEFGLDVAPRIAGIAGQPAGVIVIVTNDYEGASGGGGGKNEG